MSRTRLVLGFLAVATFFWAGSLLAHGSGISATAQSTTGCACHGSTPNLHGIATVTITGPQVVQPGSTHAYTIAVSGGPTGTTGGFDLLSGAGTFVPGTGTKVLNGDLTHSDATRRSWTFNWQAPSTQGTVNWYAVAQATNGSSTSGDSWNWYGGAVNTAFPISVSALVGVAPDRPAATWLAPPVPNPSFGSSSIGFMLARSGMVRLEIVDVSGRRVATLVDGVLGPGRHDVSWNGRCASGQPAASGVYAVRLAAEGRFLTRSIALVR